MLLEFNVFAWLCPVFNIFFYNLVNESSIILFLLVIMGKKWKTLPSVPQKKIFHKYEFPNPQAIKTNDVWH